MLTEKIYHNNVFINCPFDEEYEGMFWSIVFTVYACGFLPRSALQFGDAGETRFEQLIKVIRKCRFGIHDISRTELHPANNLPRFNMPLELGLFLGAKKFGGGIQKEKVCLIVDKESYRYQGYISDIAGQDIIAHGGNSERLIMVIRNWLRKTSERHDIPGGEIIITYYREFMSELPRLCEETRINRHKMEYVDHTYLMESWLLNKFSPPNTF